MFISNNRTSFELRWKENLVKHQKVSKYYETRCRNKSNRIESKISEALINNEIIHEDFMTIINEEKQYRELKESTGMMYSQRSVVEEINAKTVIFLKCATYGSKKLRYIKNQEGKGLVV